MQVSKIIEVLQSRYDMDEEIMVDWWDEEHFNMFFESLGLDAPDWYESVISYENREGAEINSIWLEIYQELTIRNIPRIN